MSTLDAIVTLIKRDPPLGPLLVTVLNGEADPKPVPEAIQRLEAELPRGTSEIVQRVVDHLTRTGNQPQQVYDIAKGTGLDKTRLTNLLHTSKYKHLFRGDRDGSRRLWSLVNRSPPSIGEPNTGSGECPDSADQSQDGKEPPIE
jgi:hypothetical protein